MRGLLASPRVNAIGLRILFRMRNPQCSCGVQRTVPQLTFSFSARFVNGISSVSTGFFRQLSILCGFRHTSLQKCQQIRHSVLSDGPPARRAATSWRVYLMLPVWNAAVLPLVGMRDFLPTSGRTNRGRYTPRSGRTARSGPVRQDSSVCRRIHFEDLILPGLAP